MGAIDSNRNCPTRQPKIIENREAGRDNNHYPPLDISWKLCSKVLPELLLGTHTNF